MGLPHVTIKRFAVAFICGGCAEDDTKSRGLKPFVRRDEVIRAAAHVLLMSLAATTGLCCWECGQLVG
jgi:hypothetical protein